MQSNFSGSEHMDIRNQHACDTKKLIDVLTVNYKSIYYVTYDEEDIKEFMVYRSNKKLDDIIKALFEQDEEKVKSGDFGDTVLYEEDCEKLWSETRKSVVMKNIIDNSIYYVFFRVFIGGRLHYYKIKFAADIINQEVAGIVIAVIDNGAIERVKRREELELYQEIDNAERTIMERTAELRERTLALSFTNTEVIDLLGNVVELRNKESGLHIKRVKSYTRILAEQVMKDFPEYSLTTEAVDNIVSASSLHDVGKIMVPDAILLKQGRLTSEEIMQMQKHCEYGLEILSSAPKSWTSQYTKTALDICHCHHEKWDGKGYPRGLKGDEIPISAQIVSVADCYDALTTKRVYKPAYSPEESFKMIISGECGAFSEKILSCFEICRKKFEKTAANPEEFREKALVQLSGVNKLKGLNILLVDDSEMNLEINSDILENEGAIITTAENGIKAIEKYMNEGPFDAIIMDIVMPEMNGIEATKKIREIEHVTGNHVPVIALSAEGKEHKTIMDAGIDASMAKPLVVGEFTRILISCMHNSSIQMQKQLVETLKIANTDALTKVKSIAAYSDMTASLNNEIKDKDHPKFSIVVCDINDLKYANDTYGHEIGNYCIKNCCKILCSVFSHSPVYRIGGDEFVVVLEGVDYSERDSKIELLRKRISEAEKIDDYANGRTSFAVGISDYNPKTDTEVRDVQTRADTAMYIDKRNKKDGIQSCN